jgi:crotonobetainyl-CoA:carnitine CoA-transferase CaiB-like acyl-CoA transferase
VLERLGLGVEQLRSLNPQLIVCSISGYGQTGPMALRAGHDVNYLSRAGVLGLTGPADGVPAIPAVQVADLAGGALYAAFGIAAALYRRTRQFAGCHLDISMTDGVASLLAPIVAMTAAGGSAPRRGGEMLSGGIPCYRTYETSDHRYVSVGALEPKFWSQVVEAVGHPELLTDAFATGDRGALVMQTLEQAFAARPFAEWREVFAGLDACVEPILTVDELIHDAHLVARRSIAVMADGAVQVKPPTSPAIHPEVHAPRLGEHTRKLLTEAGLTARELDALEARGVIVQAR